MNILAYTQKTNTTKFILPLLFDEKTNWRELYENRFVNAYIYDMANDDNHDKIHLLFAEYPSLSFLQNLKNPISQYQYIDGFVIVYPLELKWEKDYIKLIEGEYSKICEEAKSRLLSFWEEDNHSLMWCVLYKEGNAVRKYFEKIIGKEIYEPWTKEKEWWLPFKFIDEILPLNRS
jgi:hypothetical protein